MSYRIICSALLCSSLLVACSGPIPNGSIQQAAQTSSIQSQHVVLASALQKRPLALARINGQMVPVAALAESPAFGLAQVATAISADIAVSRPAIAPGYYYGGHDFNQYVIQFAEENLYGAPKGTSLLQVYNQSVKPILSEWDASARLLESRAQVNGTDDEYIYLPGQDENKPLRLRPLYVYRFASSSKKETLNIYVLEKEIRVHRMVWGSPNIEIARVKIDSDRALEIARKAFASRAQSPGYPVYPEANDTSAQVVYELPQELSWNLSLNQQSRDQLRYFLHFNFRQGNDGVPLPIPVPHPMPLGVEPALMDAPVGVAVSPARPIAPPYQYLSGSIEIDAITGEIKSLNRPVIYRQYDGGGVSYPGYPGPEGPPPELMDSASATDGGAAPQIGDRE